MDSRRKSYFISEIVFPLILTGLILLIFLPLFTRLVQGTARFVPYTDHPAHNVFAAQMRQEHRVSMPHPVYHFVVIGFQELFELTGLAVSPDQTPVPGATDVLAAAGTKMQGAALAGLNYRYSRASICTLVLFYVFTALFLQSTFRKSLASTGVKGELVNLLLTLSLLVMGPIALLHGRDHDYYFGYISGSLWHSPTMLAAKMFALPLFLAVVGSFNKPYILRRPLLYGMKLFCITVVGMFAKPSLVMAMVPAVILLSMWQSVVAKESKQQWIMLLLAFIVPAVCVVLIQARMYESVNVGSHIRFAPFATVREMSPGTWGWKLLLSILFPAACYLLTNTKGQCRQRLTLAWLTFAFGLCMMYLLSESKRTSHGNLIWGAQLAMYVLMVESVRAVIEWWKINRSPDQKPVPAFGFRFAVLLLLFVMHLGYGVAYYLHLRTEPVSTELIYK